jgi:SAM-dependent methyltransferase
MRRQHFAAFAPHCPRCAAAGNTTRQVLELAYVGAARGDDVLAGILLCPNPACRHEYPIIDGIPIIVGNLAPLLAERAVELLLRQDLDPALESLIGDAIGPGTWFDVLRQTISTYAWDGWADLDPAEAPGAGPRPGAARNCLARLEELADAGPPAAPIERVLDLGCGAGRTSFDLAARHPAALVLGVDIGLALLRLAHGAAGGQVTYARRRIGLVYDRRSFAVAPAGAERVDFWACDALALPFPHASADRVAALNLLDCVTSPQRLLAGMAELLRPGGRLLLATPYDWAAQATPPAAWIGGHSQRAADAGAGEPFLRALLREGAHAQSVAGLRLLGEATNWPWQTRLHERSAVQYASHLLALQKQGEGRCPSTPPKAGALGTQ